MKLSNDLVSLFVKATKDTTKTSHESTVYGTVVQYGDSKYVQIDGSDQLTPCASVADASVGERVSVLIKNHTATITGNLSSPSAKSSTVQAVDGAVSGNVAYKITATDIEAVNGMFDKLQAILIECDELSAEEIYAVTAQIETLKSKYIEGEYITTTELKAITAEIESLQATFGNFTDLSTEHLSAVTAEISQLKVYSGDFTYLVAEELKAMHAVIDDLDVENLDAKYANIDFANIGEAAIRKLFSDYGLIKDLVVGDGTITGELVGVTIKGDLIEGNTIKADKLVVKGSDGLYYKLNFEGGTFAGGEEVPTDSLHGSVITAKSITAEKVSVKDLVAFGATIGGFNITTDAIYSGVKQTVNNSTRGIYMDRDGQFAVGDANNFLKYYRDETGLYKLTVAAGSIVLGTSGKTVEEALDEVANMEIGSRNLIRNSKVLMFDQYKFEDAYLDFSYDMNGNVLVRSNAMAIDHDSDGNITLASVLLGVDHDEDTGNVTLYSTLDEDGN